jgi:hypothetical protein
MNHHPNGIKSFDSLLCLLNFLVLSSLIKHKREVCERQQQHQSLPLPNPAKSQVEMTKQL